LWLRRSLLPQRNAPRKPRDQRPLSNPYRNRNRTRPAEPQTANDGKKQSYMDAMAAAGVKITDVDELISLKIQA